MTLWLPAAFSLVAAVVHFEVAPEHFQEYLPFGIFFVLSGLVQVAWAVTVLWRPTRSVLLAGACGNLLIVLLWMVSRTAGLPIGPEPWTHQAVGTPDVIASLSEAEPPQDFGGRALLFRGLRVQRLPGHRALGDGPPAAMA